MMRTDDRTEEQVQIMQAQRGDLSAFQALLERYAPSAYTLALGMTGDGKAGETALTAAVLSLWKTLPAFPLDEGFAARLSALVVHSVGEIRPPDPQNQTETSKTQEETLLRCLGQLSEGHRSILLLRETAGLTWEEIGGILNLTPGTAESRGKRALEELQNGFSDGGEPISAEELTALLHQMAPLPAGCMESLLAAVADQPQDIPFTNLPQNRDIHASQRAQLKTWRKPILIVAALVACFLLILGIGRLAQTIGSAGQSSVSTSTAP